jgi:uncharacterized protein (DUF2062 family)
MKLDLGSIREEVARRGFRRSLAELLFRLWTEADSAARQGWSIALGVAIGCLPLYGMHLPLCVLFGSLLGLNRVKMVLASNFNNPLFGPLLVYLEVQAGSLVRRGSMYAVSWAELRHVDPWTCFGDLAIGSVVVGVVCGTSFGFLTWFLVRAGSDRRQGQATIERAARRFLSAGFVHWERVRSQLRRDPVWYEIAADPRMPTKGLVLHLGCGRGGLLALLDELHQSKDGAHPAFELGGVDARMRHVRVARKVLDGVAQIECTDLGQWQTPRCAGVVAVDLLHHLDRAEQERLIEAIGERLEVGGTLWLRERCRRWGWQQLAWHLIERVRLVVRGRPLDPVYFRTADEWKVALEKKGLSVRGVEANASRVLLKAQRGYTPTDRGDQ